MKTALQVRAERCAASFSAASRRPIVIEFAGLPKAGKTTTLGQVQAFLRRCGFKVEVVIERASVCPIRDKKHAHFNVWTACTTLAQVLQHTQVPPQPDDPDIVILDRGLFDAICWLSVLERLSRIREEDRKSIEQFLLLNDWCNRISGVVLMTASPKDALTREKGHLPVEGPGGSIMNIKVLTGMKRVLDEVSKRLVPNFTIYKINTSSSRYAGSPKKSCEDVASKVLDWIEDELEEEILTLSKLRVGRLFGGKQCLGPYQSRALIEQFSLHGNYLARADAETKKNRIQALPVVVVRNKRGDVLRLRRKEKQETSSLHKRVVIWAGGHVRREDESNGNPIVAGAIRELEEELRLSVEPDNLHLLGAIHSKVSEGTTKHVAFVYEWRAERDEVEIALSNAEFFERMGNSLSGTFVSSEALLADYENEAITEDWSCQIIRNFMADTAPRARRDLFDRPA